MKGEVLPSVASSGWQGLIDPTEFGQRTLTLSHSRDPRMVASVVVSVESAMGNDWSPCIIIVL